MNQAIKFIQEHGLEYATDVVKENKTKLKIFSTFEMDLKRLVESHELVKSRGGLDAAKHELILLQKHLNNTFGYVTIITSEKIENLKQAIVDVESCFETDKKLEGL